MHSISDLIVEFHRLYAVFKRPEYLKIAANLGKMSPDTFDEDWKKKVNDGCTRQGLPLAYPDAVN